MPPSSPQKHIVFDVVGTLVSFHAFHDKINKLIGAKLLSNPIPINPQLFAHAWMTDAEVEYTFLSISGRYIPYSQVMCATFYRTLHFAGVSKPRELVTEEEMKGCLSGYSELGLREGAAEALSKLKGAGFKVWCFTSGDQERVEGYFHRAGMERDDVPKIVCCDVGGVAKPALKAYRAVMDRIPEGEEKWFAAAHHWDVSAAVRCGFRGAYCTEYEGEGLWEVFGRDMDVVGGSLVDMAERVISASK